MWPRDCTLSWLLETEGRPMQQVSMERSDASVRPPKTTQHISGPTPASRTADAHNVGVMERVISTVIGSAILLRGIQRPSPRAAAWAAGGGALWHPGVTGHCYIYQA